MVFTVITRRSLILCASRLEPAVVKGFLARDALALVDNEQLLDKIFAILADLPELIMVEVVLGALDLAEDFVGVFALEG